MRFASSTNSVAHFDDIRVLADSFSDTYTYAYNTANELTSTTSPNGTISYAYDDWGRMTQKNKGFTWVATYGYRYGSRLYSVASVLSFLAQKERTKEKAIGGNAPAVLGAHLASTPTAPLGIDFSLPTFSFSKEKVGTASGARGSWAAASRATTGTAATRC